MKEITNILAVYGRQIGSEETLLCAQNLARRTGARLTIAEVVERLPGDGVTRFLPPLPEGLDGRSQLIEECRSRLDRIAVSVGGDSLDVQAMLLTGKPVAEVVNAVVRHGYDMVLIADDMPLVWRYTEFSAVTTRLVRKCPCPVWVVRPGFGGRFTRVLAAIDPPLSEPEDDCLDVRIVGLAAAIARSEGARLDILNAWELAPADAATSDSEVRYEMRRALARKNRAKSEAAVQRVLASVDLAGVDYDLLFPKGNPAPMIAAHALESGSDLIIMGAESRAGINRLLLGDTAEDVLRRVDCPVLTVKPARFEARIRVDPANAAQFLSSGP